MKIETVPVYDLLRHVTIQISYTEGLLADRSDLERFAQRTNFVGIDAYLFAAVTYEDSPQIFFGDGQLHRLFTKGLIESATRRNREMPEAEKLFAFQLFVSQWTGKIKNLFLKNAPRVQEEEMFDAVRKLYESINPELVEDDLHLDTGLVGYERWYWFHPQKPKDKQFEVA